VGKDYRTQNVSVMNPILYHLSTAATKYTVTKIFWMYKLLLKG